MKEGYIQRPEINDTISDKKIVTLSFKTLTSATSPEVLRLKRCNGKEHWFEDQTATEIPAGVLDIEVEHPSGKTECDCPDKENRKDAFDLFK